jgi:hypothetical protein
MRRILMVGLLGLSSLGLIACDYEGVVSAENGPLAVELQDQTVELGHVRWQRDLAAAQKVSAETGKPLFVQFQEVPG